jgi:hypothetical protein
VFRTSSGIPAARAIWRHQAVLTLDDRARVLVHIGTRSVRSIQNGTNSSNEN